jgi:hypothetical protein
MRRWVVWLVAIVFGSAVLSATAQDAARVAFVNGSGQLVVSSGDGTYRWIVTNPGEILANPLGYSWSPNGDRLFFAIDMGGEVSLRVGDAASQSIVEIGRVPNDNLSGGAWTASAVVVGAGEQISAFDASTGAVTDWITGQGPVKLLSPYVNDRPNLPAVSSLSPSGEYVFYQQGDGRYAVAALGGGGFALPGVNDADARLNGLWADSAPFVAYWGFEGNSILSVTDAASGATVTLDSGVTTPIMPIGWQSGTSQLLYRDGVGVVRLADLSCLSSGCGANPLESGVEFLPASAADVVLNGDWAFYRDGAGVYGLWLGCAASGTCAGSAVQLGDNAVPGAMIHAAGGMLAYTGYGADANNAYDREVRIVALGCVNSGGCSAQSALTGAVSGLVSPSGESVVVEQVGTGLSILNLSTLSTSFLSDGGLLATARWG